MSSPEGKIIARRISPDVPERDYYNALAKLVILSQYFKPDQISGAVYLAGVIERNAKQMAIVVRAVGDISRSEGTGWITYTPRIRSERFRASLFADYGVIGVAFGKNGFDTKERPLDGVEMMLYDGSGNDNWKNENSYQLSVFGHEGNITRSININKIIARKDVFTLAQCYGTAVRAIVNYAKGRNEFVEKNNRFAFRNRNS